MTIFTHDQLPQGSEDWFKKRLGKFTCSDAQAIQTAGKGLETLIFTKVAELKTGLSMDNYDNEAMKNGRELEDVARSVYELEKGVEVNKVGFIEFDEWVGGSPDGIVADDGLIEIKCPTNKVYVEYLYYKKIDPKYLAQMQMQLLVSGRKYVDYVVFNQAFKKYIVIERVLRNEVMIQLLQTGLNQGIKRATEILAKI